MTVGELEVKGLPAPVLAFRVVRESRAGSRFEALRTGETPLVGRDGEIELLSRRWVQAKAGKGQVVLVSAEPGIGKSRLTVAFRQSLGERGGSTPNRTFDPPSSLAKRFTDAEPAKIYNVLVRSGLRAGSPLPAQ